MNKIDVIILGAGAAGMMCGIEAGTRGRKVLILEKTNKPGKKILMSGGGRCNFTNLYTNHDKFLSHNPHFCKSALSRFTPDNFIAMVHRHKIKYFEKTLGQLFCEEKSQLIVEMLLAECQKSKVQIALNQTVHSIQKNDSGFVIKVNDTQYLCESLVVATGGLSIPTLGSSPLGYQIAAQFGIPVYPTRAGLVPLTLHTHDKERLAILSGIAVSSEITCHQQSFIENLLFTHRGLSGPAVLQISSYWSPGDTLSIKLLPELDLFEHLKQARHHYPDRSLKTILEYNLPKRLLSVFYEEQFIELPIKQFSDKQLEDIAYNVQCWLIKPNGTEGYRTAEVTLGGIDCNALSSQRFEANTTPGLFFIGELIDVTGWLGGYNFQWAWSSGWAAGQVV